ncbi:energy transducer TonB [Hydrogenophaga soli]|nr:TonB family protein [Burkholderiaceae bacterium]
MSAATAPTVHALPAASAAPATWGGLSVLHWALALSLAVHGGLLTWRFAAPQTFNRVFKDTPLEVVLVNARSHERPDKAQAIAQANLMGGGEAAKGRATSPLPPLARLRAGEDASDADERRLEAMKAEQTLLLARLKKELATYAPPQPTPQNLTPQQQEQERKRQQMVKLLAEIEKRVNEENARPRKRFLGPSTREEVYALYYDELRRRIEHHGTSHFPEVGGKKLYGELTMIITVNHDGRVLDTEVVERSGKRVLDERAQAIVRSLSFGPFSDAMRQRADQIVVVSRFKFTRDEALNTTLSTPVVANTQP